MYFIAMSNYKSTTNYETAKKQIDREEEWGYKKKYGQKERKV
jgi:hypothetical protein